MGVIFQVRGNSLDAFRSAQGGQHGKYVYSSPSAPAVVSDAGAFGGQALSVGENAKRRALMYPGFRNLGFSHDGLHLRYRTKPWWTTSPGGIGVPFFSMWSGMVETPYRNIFDVYVQPDGKIFVYAQNAAGLTICSAATTTAPSWSSSSFIDVQITWDGTAGAGKIKLSVNGVLFHSFTATNSGFAAVDKQWIPYVLLGSGLNLYDLKGVLLIDEFVMHDAALPTAYTARTDYDTATARDPLNNAWASVADLRSGASQTKEGTVENGTLETATAGQLAIGVTVGGVTGTYAATERYTDLDEDVVLDQETWRYNSLTPNRTGTRVDADPGDVREGALFGPGGELVGQVIVPTAAQTKHGVDFDAPVGGSDPTTGDVAWNNLTNSTAGAGGALTKTSANAWDQIAWWTDSFTGDCSIVFSGPTTHDTLAGLVVGTPGSLSPKYQNGDFMIYIENSNVIRVWERTGGGFVYAGAAASGSDEFTVERVGGTVEYKRNGTTFYTSLQDATGLTLHAIATAYQIGQFLTSATFTEGATVEGTRPVGTYRGADLYTILDPADVRSLLGYTADGEALIGELESPTAGVLKHGVVVDGVTGTYRGADLYTEVPPSKVQEGYAYTSDGEAKVGTKKLTSYQVEDGVFEADDEDNSVSIGGDIS